MKFLAVLIALVVYRVRGEAHEVQRDDWFYRWAETVRAWRLPPWLALALVVLAPALVAQGVLDALDDFLFGLVWIVAAAVLVLYSLGRGDLAALRDRYRGQCLSGDFEGALHSTLPALDLAAPPEAVSASDVHAAVQRGLFYQAFQRWFAVLFWFVLAGPAGALAYRLLQLSRDCVEPALTEQVLRLADWLPARLLAATFTVCGDFVRSRALLADAIAQGEQDTGELLYGIGRAASRPDDPVPDASFEQQAAAEHEEAVALVSRSVVAWIGAMALLVLIS